MPRRDDKPRGSSPIEPRPADEDRGRFRPKMGRRARRSAHLRRAWVPGATRGAW